MEAKKYRKKQEIIEVEQHPLHDNLVQFRDKDGDLRSMRKDTLNLDYELIPDSADFEKAKTDFILKWGFERGQPLFKEIEAELDSLMSMHNLPSDEEIENANPRKSSSWGVTWMEGAKWMRERLTKL